MELQTKISLQSQLHNQIDYNSNVLLLGSCFVENIGEKLNYYKFQNTINPFGILFHPIAIERLVTNAINQKKYTEEDIFFHNERWHCFDAHSKLSSTSKENLLKELNKQINLTAQQLNNVSHVIITLGTAWVYRDIETEAKVANCHKVPQKQFKKEILSIEEITSSLENIERQIRLVNPNIQFIYTVSPVRHLKDGFIENTQSKAHLISAIHQSLNQKSAIANHQSCYFPSYEIMMDELRDYRFYTDDMIHPNDTAINYIWKKFKAVWMSAEVYSIMDEVESIQKGLRHKPFNPKSKAHIQFLEHLENKIGQLRVKYSHIAF